MTVFLKKTRHRARRRHKRPCFACGLSILPGDHYSRTGAIDDTWYVVVLHEQCDTEVQAHYAGGPDDEWPQGCLDGSYLDHDDECSPEWVAWFNERRQQEETACTPSTN